MMRSFLWPLVLAADVLYEESHADDLVRSLPRWVAMGGRAIIADPGRRYRPVLEAGLRVSGWSVRELGVIEEPAAAGTVSRVALVEVRAQGKAHG